MLNTSCALGLPVSENLCAPASAQAVWQKSARKSVALLGRERGTGLFIEQPITRVIPDSTLRAVTGM